MHNIDFVFFATNKKLQARMLTCVLLFDAV